MWHPDTHELYFVDIAGQAVHRFRPSDGRHDVFGLPDQVTSVSLRERGGLALSLRKTFAFFDPDTDDLEVLDDPEPDRPGNRFNDARCDPQGRLWAGTMSADDWWAPTGAVYRLDPDRRIERMIDDVRCSNGTDWSPDGRTMYHTQSFRYAIDAYDFDPETGAIGNARPFVTLPSDGGGFPDGLTVDEEGFVWSSQPVYGRLCGTTRKATSIRSSRSPSQRDQLRLRWAGPPHALHHLRHRDPDGRRARGGAAGRERVRVRAGGRGHARAVLRRLNVSE